MNELETILQGIDGLGFVDSEIKEGLLGAIVRLPDLKQRTVAAKAFALKASKPIVPSGNMNSRDLAKLHITELPRPIIEALHARSMQFVDVMFATTKVASAQTQVDMFKGDDTLTTGKSNISNAKLEKDNHVLITDIAILSGVGAGVGADDGLTVAYGIADKTILNGEFDFTSASRDIVQKKTSCGIFDSTNRTDIMRGFHRLSSPKWMAPQEILALQLRLSAAAPLNTWVKVVLVGQAVVKG